MNGRLADALRSRYGMLLLALIILGLLSAVAIFLRPLTPIDETRYVGVAWEMWLRGDFLLPIKNGAPYSHKPPLMIWLFQAGWAAFGVNRPASGDRTVPYWRHVMVMDLYLAMADGVWGYEPKAHALLLHMKDDIRAQTGHQDFVAGAPLNLIYVAHGERMTDISPEERRLYASVDAGFIGQNIYLFCASEGLATVFRGAVDTAKLGRTLQLPDQQFVTFAQTVGYPKA